MEMDGSVVKGPRKIGWQIVLSLLWKTKKGLRKDGSVVRGASRTIPPSSSVVDHILPSKYKLLFNVSCVPTRV